MNPNILIHTRIALLLKLNVQMETILAAAKFDFAVCVSDAQVFKQCAFDMAQLNIQIADHFLEEGDAFLFQMTTKMHMVLHCALLAEFINPRTVRRFPGEDMMKHIQVLASSCVKGLQGYGAVNKMVSHYRLGLHLQISGVQIH